MCVASAVFVCVSVCDSAQSWRRKRVRESEEREREWRIVVSLALVCFSNVKIKIPSGVETVTLFPREREA